MPARSPGAFAKRGVGSSGSLLPASERLLQNNLGMLSQPLNRAHPVFFDLLPCRIRHGIGKDNIPQAPSFGFECLFHLIRIATASSKHETATSGHAGRIIPPTASTIAIIAKIVLVSQFISFLLQGYCPVTIHLHRNSASRQDV